MWQQEIQQQQPSHYSQGGWQPMNRSISRLGEEIQHQHVCVGVSSLEEGVVLHQEDWQPMSTSIDRLGEEIQHQPMCVGVNNLEEGTVRHQNHYLHNLQLGLQPTSVEAAIGHQQHPPNDCHIEWQPIIAEDNPIYDGLPPNGLTEYSTTIRQEATHRMRQYWAMMKRESRQRKRERDASCLSTPEDMSTVCTTMVLCWQEATKGMNCEAKKATFQLLLEKPAFRSLHHGSEKSILSNIQGTITKVKASLSEEELKFKRALCMMLVNSKGDPSTSISNSEMARFTGLHRRNFAAANSRLKQANAGSFPLQLCRRQQPQSHCITQEIRDIVFAFWQTETRVSPNKKDVCRKRLGRKSYIKHPVHLLDESQVCSKSA